MGRGIRKLGVTTVVLLAASVFAGCGGAAPSDAAATRAAGTTVGNIRIGELAPELHTEPLQGAGPKTLAEGRGKVVLIDFWATFCKPCKALLPEYQTLVDQYDGKLAVIAVSVDEPDDVDAERIKSFVDDLGISFSVVWDRKHATVSRYDPPSMPTTYLVDQQGVVRYGFTGLEGGDSARIRQAIDELLRPGP
jgi:thiol-disulfide isomerase/thioredoxin